MGKVAISIVRSNVGLGALMDDRFGRAEAFLVVDGGAGGTIETIENVSAMASRRAEDTTAKMLKSAGVDAVIARWFRPEAFDALRALGIEAWIAAEGSSAGLALRMMEEGRLERMRSQADR